MDQTIVPQSGVASPVKMIGGEIPLIDVGDYLAGKPGALEATAINDGFASRPLEGFIKNAALDDVKAALEGRLKPIEEVVHLGRAVIRDTFKISKVGTIAGCMVLDGKVNRNSKVRVIRDGIVVFAGELGSLKRFKDDVKEVSAGYECGLSIQNFNDIKVGDVIEGYEQVAVKRTLA